VLRVSWLTNRPDFRGFTRSALWIVVVEHAALT